VMITVLDVNDNRPVFTRPQYNGTIEENSLPSVLVAIVSCKVISVYVVQPCSIGSTNRG